MPNLNKTMAPIFVVGTDTGVGKTVLSLLLMQFFFLEGYTPFYLKPVQTGCMDPYDTDSDAAFVYLHANPLRDKDPAESVIYCFKNPKAPLIAARDEEKTIELSIIEQRVAEKAAMHTPLIIEAAGGVLVPITERTYVADLILLAKAQPLIAARAGLGTINHTLLTIEALKSRGISPSGVIFIDAGEKRTSPESIEENRSAIEELSGVKVAGVIGRISDFSNPPQKSYEPLKDIFN
jgi:dethiobiotin synthetase